MRTEYSFHIGASSAQCFADIRDLCSILFGDYLESEGNWRFRNMPDFSIFSAQIDGRLVGLKMGYAITPTRYYSWLGGVDPDYRRQGIAQELMRRQHLWLNQRGYQSVETGARQSNHAMARLNLASGFRVVGIRYKGNDPDVLYEKCLN